MKKIVAAFLLCVSGSSYSWTICSQKVLVSCYESEEVFRVFREATGNTEAVAKIRLDEKISKGASKACQNTPAWQILSAGSISCESIED